METQGRTEGDSNLFFFNFYFIFFDLSFVLKISLL